jgi:hypothetical protein
MKKLLIFIGIAIALQACKDEDKMSNGILPVMTFAEKEHDFGTIPQDEKVNYDFNFTNTGAINLIISNAVGSCGCTIPQYTHEPVAPGESGVINVSFNSAGKSGIQHKTVTITANTKAGQETISIKASITPSAGKNSGITSHS